MALGPSAAIRALQLELKNINKEPVEGVVIDVPDEGCLYEWHVGIFGPPGTLYEGGYFKVRFGTIQVTQTYVFLMKKIAHSFTCDVLSVYMRYLIPCFLD